MAMLAIDRSAVSMTGVISVSEGGLAGLTLKNIVVNIEGNIALYSAAGVGSNIN